MGGGGGGRILFYSGVATKLRNPPPPPPPAPPRSLSQLERLTSSVSRLNIFVLFCATLSTDKTGDSNFSNSKVLMTCGKSRHGATLWHPSEPLAPTARQCGQLLYRMVSQLPPQWHPSLVSRMTGVSSSPRASPLVEFMYLVFTFMSGESALLLCLSDVFWAADYFPCVLILNPNSYLA